MPNSGLGGIESQSPYTSVSNYMNWKNELSHIDVAPLLLRAGNDNAVEEVIGGLICTNLVCGVSGR